MPLWRRILIGPVKLVQLKLFTCELFKMDWQDSRLQASAFELPCRLKNVIGVKPEAWIDTTWLQVTHFRLLQKIYTVRSDSVRLYQSKHVGCDSVICHCVPRLQRKIYIYYIYLLGLGVIHCWKCRAQRLAAKQRPHMPAVSSLNKAYTQFSPYIYPTQCSRHIKRLPWDH